MQSWGVDLVLTAYSLYESLGVSLVGMHHGIGEKFQQSVDNLIACEFYVENLARTIDMLGGKLGTVGESIAHSGRDVADEAALKLAAQYLLLVVGEHSYTLLFNGVDDARTHVDDAFVGIADIGIGVLDGRALFWLKEVEQQLACLVGGDDMQFVGILNVHYLITDIVGSLHKVGERIACIADAQPVILLADDAEVVGYLAEERHLALEETELALAPAEQRAVGIFHYGGEGAASHHVAAFAPTFILVGE